MLLLVFLSLACASHGLSLYAHGALRLPRYLTMLAVPARDKASGGGRGRSKRKKTAKSAGKTSGTPRARVLKRSPDGVPDVARCHPVRYDELLRDKAAVLEQALANATLPHQGCRRRGL